MRNNRNLIKTLFLLIILILLLTASGCGSSTSSIVFIGDSLTYGTPFGTDHSWVAALRRDSGKKYINVAIPGQSSGQMLERFEKEVLETKPQKVVIMAGTIDADHGDAVTKYAANITAMVKKARRSRVEPILVTSLPTAYPELNTIIKKYRRWLIDYTGREGITLIDFYPLLEDKSSGLLKTEYDYDGIHPTSEGYLLLGKAAGKII